ncbi:LPS export ABC transporter permease LptF [Microvirga tunisiensis]|uniref:LPS export ABC transporter permease LptF n=2 Tax=Pannonibacter tanglangensis TaxID=2750084 RepID=A0A7X5F0W8_9HYPH|nr:MULTISPECIES: LPS export ABC transporter permease LptF [unclassified Pannonibacter]NBN64096.1 LPS export ABC transporter permease LptF [Pannonibacter sp. XCT-34]NBN77737.1 LPS export ABC transporter permease LptF [Pannonibacter sp. XCT-53]
MKTLERYIIRRSLLVFVMTLAAMTGVVWATQALRQLDLVTSKGQTIVQFISITMLAMPFLVVIVAPFALMIALILVLNALSSDSELIVINATGGSRWLVLQPVLMFALAVTAATAFFSLYVAPLGLAQLRDEIARVRVDLVANIVRPGRFITVEDGLTFHIRNRSGDGKLDGLLLHDTRDPETIFTYQANQGNIVEAAGRTLLIMQNGTIQRRPKRQGDISIVRFQSYAFDLSSLIPEASEPVYKASERSTYALMFERDIDDYARGNRERLIGELHSRFSQPLYPLAFALVVFAFLGQARTTRQSRGMAILGALTACILLRTAGFGVTSLTAGDDAMMVGHYLVPLAGMAAAIWAILHSEQAAPAWMGRLTERIGEAADALQQRLQGRMGGGTS